MCTCSAKPSSAINRRACIRSVVVATSGTVDVGAIDELNAIAEVAQRHQLWFHVDGACGALGMFSSEIAKLLSGIDRADSIALDFTNGAKRPTTPDFCSSAMVKPS